MQKIDSLLNSLFAKHRFNIKPGLERTEILLNHLGNPQNKLKIIHIAGTNGKGGTCSFLASFLKEMGFKTGLYTSPHLFKFNERIRINGDMIDDESIINIYENLEDISNEIGATFFEITTVIAFKYFEINNIDYAVIETGMGGRFDSTNLCSPIITAITSIHYDHKEYLGDTLEKIAYEKAGIIKSNITTVFNTNIIDSAKEIIVNQAKELNSKLLVVEPEKILNFNSNFSIITQKYGKLNIVGRNQFSNFNMALRILDELSLLINEDLILKSINNLYKNTGYFGRFSIVSQNPNLILDVAHNDESIDNLIEILKLHTPYQKYDILFSCLDDKNYESMIMKLSEVADRIILTGLQNYRAIKIDKFYDFKEKNKNLNIIINENLEEAIIILKEKSNNMIVTGSFYLIEEIKNYIFF